MVKIKSSLLSSIEIPAELIEINLDKIDFNDVRTTKEIVIPQHNVVGELFSIIQSLAEENQKLRDKINLLEGEKGLPKIKASASKKEDNAPNLIKETFIKGSKFNVTFEVHIQKICDYTQKYGLDDPLKKISHGFKVSKTPEGFIPLEKRFYIVPYMDGYYAGETLAVDINSGILKPCGVINHTFYLKQKPKHEIEPTAPSFQITPPKWDAEILQGKSSTNTFTIKNSCKYVYSIMKLESKESWLTFDFSDTKNTIKPGQSTTFKVSTNRTLGPGDNTGKIIIDTYEKGGPYYIDVKLKVKPKQIMEPAKPLVQPSKPDNRDNPNIYAIAAMNMPSDI